MEYDAAIRRLPRRIGIAMSAVCVLASILTWPSLPAVADQSSETLDRPKIGLVLAGGGAKGIAHVGVIKVLEDAGVPIDMIAGTSMGAIVGALYAMGHPAEELEQIVQSIDWDRIFVDDTPRQERSIRRKTDDVGFLAEPRLRLKDGQARLPLGAIRGQRLTIELRRLMRPAQEIIDFDKLPRRFRAVAADLETGEEVVLAGGDLALAVRASMSFPGAFPPVEVDSRVLVDGGIVNNIPVSVVRELGADIIIVSSFKETHRPAKELTSAISVLRRAIDIMTLDGRQEQLASLGSDDILIITDLDDIGVASFDRAEDAVARGEAAAREHFERLVSLGRPDDEDTEKLVSRLKSHRIRSITIETDTSLSEEVLRARLLTKVGDAFEPDKIEEDLSRIYGLGLFQTVTYDVEPADEDVTLHIIAKENSAGKDYFRFGLNLQTNFGKESSYDAAVSYTVPAINELNGEWRSTAVIGERLGAATELYQPLGPADSVFLRPSVGVLDRDVNVFEDRRKIAETRVFEARVTFDVGLNLNDDLAIFSRITRGFGRVREVTGTDTIMERGFDTAAVGLGITYDTLDSLEWPRDGARIVGRYNWSPKDLGADAEFHALSFNANIARSYHRHTLVLGQRANITIDGDLDAANLFELGGPFRLSGLTRNALTGNNSLLSRAIYFYELKRFGPSFLGIDIPLYAGASIEYGNVFDDIDDIDLNDMLVSGSLFLGADSILGPLYFGYGVTEGGDHSVYLLIGGVI